MTYCTSFLQNLVKKGVNSLKNGFFSKKRCDIIKTKPFMKNPFRYDFYNFDKILRKIFFCHFGPKVTSIHHFYKKMLFFGIFFPSKGHKMM